MREVTDPAILKELEAAPAGLREVTDPEILRQLEPPGMIDRAGEAALGAWDAATRAAKAVSEYVTESGKADVPVDDIKAPVIEPPEAGGIPWDMPTPTSFADVKAAGVSAAAFPGDLLASSIAGLTGLTELATGGGLEKAGKTIEATTGALSPTAAVQPLLSEETQKAQAAQMTAVGAMIPPGGVVAQSAEALGVDEKYTPLVEAGTNILAIGGPTAWHVLKPSVLKALGPDRLYNKPYVRPLGEVLREEVDAGRMSPQFAADIVTSVWQTGDRFGIAFRDPNWIGKVLGAEAPGYAGTVRAKGAPKLAPGPTPEPPPGPEAPRALKPWRTPELPSGPVPPPGPAEITSGLPPATPMPTSFPIKPGVDFQETWPTPPSRALPEASGVGIWKQATSPGRPGTVIRPGLPIKGKPGSVMVTPPSNLPPQEPPAPPVPLPPPEAPPTLVSAPEAPAAPTAAPGTPEFYKAEAAKLPGKVRYVGEQMGYPSFNDDTLAGNFLVKPGETVPQAFERAQARFKPAEKSPEAPKERRDLALRKIIDEMSKEDMKDALRYDELTGLKSKRAFAEEAGSKPVKVALDVNGLKWINDNVGHDVGDQVLQAVADSIHQAGGNGYRITGDEMALLADHPIAAAEAVKGIREALLNMEIVATRPDGTKQVIKGLTVTHGIGGKLDEAFLKLNADKEAAVARGERSAERGGRPPGLLQITTPRDKVSSAPAPKGVKAEVTTTVSIQTPADKFEKAREQKVSAKKKAMEQTPISRVRKGGGIKWNEAIAGEVRTYASRKEGGNKATPLQMLFRRQDKNPKGFAAAMSWDKWVQTFQEDGTLPPDAGIGDLFDLLLENKKGAGAGVKKVDEEKLAEEFEAGKEKREAEAKAEVEKKAKEETAAIAKELEEPRGDLRAADVAADELEIAEGVDKKWRVFADESEVAGPYKSKAEAQEYIDKIKTDEVAAKTPGALPEQTEKIGEEFGDIGELAGDDAYSPHRVFAPPEKTEVFRTQKKVDQYVAEKGWMTPEESKAELEKWKANAMKQGKDRVNSGKVVLSLFDLTGEWARPWHEAGYDVFTFDIQNDPSEDIKKFSSEYLGNEWGDFGDKVFAVLSANPCTDFAVSGARHFAVKDAKGQTIESVELVHQTLRTVEHFRPPVWALENPVGRIEKLTGLPPWRLSFDPNHFGDPYTKKTLLWGRFNGDLPIAPVEPTEGSKMWSQYGGKSQKTKNARAETPEGFAYSFFQANNFHDNQKMSVANKYDRLDRETIGKALDAGMKEEDIGEIVDDLYYMELNDKAANEALATAIKEKGQVKPAEGGGSPSHFFSGLGRRAHFKGAEEEGINLNLGDEFDPPVLIRPEAQRYQWYRNKEGGQEFGNRQVVSPLTKEIFEKYTKKLTDIKSFSEYLKKYPDTWVSLVYTDATKEWKLSKVGTRGEVEGAFQGIKWSIPVESFGDKVALDHGKTSDTEVKGEPFKLKTKKVITAYHGTEANFADFDSSVVGDHQTSQLGHFFTESKGEAGVFAKGGRVIAAELTIKNPKIVSWDEIRDADGRDLQIVLKAEGYDGVIIQDKGKPDNYVVFSRDQINIKPESPKGEPFKLDTEEAPTAEAPLIPEVAGKQPELFPGERAKIKLPEKPAPAPPPQGGLFGPPKKPGILDNERGAVNLDFLAAMVEAGDHIRLGVKRLLFPTGISGKHLAAAEIISSKVGRMNRAASMAVNVLKKDRRMFDKLGVNNEKVPLKNNTGIKFMSDMSVGRAMTPEMQKIADKATALFQNRIKRLAAAGAPMAKVRENYFPGMWKDKTAATAFLSKRPFKGGEQFRKEKVFQDIMEGIDAGLEPISNNPLDLVLLKLAEMDRSIMANETLRELEAKGLIRFKSIFKEMPEGFKKIDDKYGTVYGPPHVAVEEYIDQHLYDGLLKIAESLGIKHERKINAGKGALGRAMRGTQEIVTQFATEISVLAHEISHQLDFKYDLWDKIVSQAEGLGKKGKPTKAANQKQRGLVMRELRALADLKWEGQPASAGHKAYTRKKEEQMAHLLEAYIHAPERFREVAPTVFESFDKFLREMPELKAFTAVKPGLTLTRLENEKGLPGFPLIGHRVATEAVADVLNNYLSRSMYNNPYFGLLWKGVMATANTLNQTQLGVFSGFHGGFTSFEVQISAGANVLKDLWGVAHGNRTAAQLGHTLAHWPKAMGSTARLGSKLLKEWDQPGTQGGKLAQIAEAAELAGANFKLERGLRTEQTEKMIQDWYSEHKVRAALRSPISLLELGAKPIMEWLVPRQKAGVFAELAGRIIEQNPGKTMLELRPLFRQAWNRVDARLGQVAYNRLFMNNAAKNIMQGLIRAPGWTGGTIAEVGGSIPDTVRFVKEWYESGKAPENIPDRVAYTLSLILTTALANGLITYAFTGEKPEGVDYLAFRDGGVDEYGKPTRFLLPTYMKDVYAWYKKPKHTAAAKIHPVLSTELEIQRGTDYYGTQIANPEDNWFAQQVSDMKHRAKAFVPFWMRGTAKVVEREGGWKEAAKSPLKTVAPLVGIMPATAAYTRTEAEKLMGEMGQARRPLGGSSKEEADYAKLRARTLRLLRLGKKYDEFPDDVKEALDKIPENKLELIEKEAETTWLSSRFNRRTVNEKIRVWKVMNPKEREEVADIFWTAIDKHYDAMDDDDPEKELFKQKVEKVNAAAEKNK